MLLLVHLGALTNGRAASCISDEGNLAPPLCVRERVAFAPTPQESSLHMSTCLRPISTHFTYHLHLPNLHAISTSHVCTLLPSPHAFSACPAHPPFSLIASLHTCSPSPLHSCMAAVKPSHKLYFFCKRLSCYTPFGSDICVQLLEVVSTISDTIFFCAHSM